MKRTLSRARTSRSSTDGPRIITKTLPQLAADLVGHQVTVIAATSTPVALAAKAATNKIPVVFMIGGDPVKGGLVESLSRPGGNATGVTRYNVELAPKLARSRAQRPPYRTAGQLFNPSNPNTATLLGVIEKSADALGVEILLARAADDGD